MKQNPMYLIAGLLFTLLAPGSFGGDSYESETRKKPAGDLERQQATTRDIRTIGAALEMYAVDHNAYPGPTKTDEEVGLFLKGKLEPTYVRNLPSVDGWEWPFWYSSDGTEYTLISLGKDGVPDTREGGATNSFDCDIVFSNGAFFQWPSGTQT